MNPITFVIILDKPQFLYVHEVSISLGTLQSTQKLTANLTLPKWSRAATSLNTLPGTPKSKRHTWWKFQEIRHNSVVLLFDNCTYPSDVHGHNYYDHARSEGDCGDTCHQPQPNKTGSSSFLRQNLSFCCRCACLFEFNRELEWKLFSKLSMSMSEDTKVAAKTYARFFRLQALWRKQGRNSTKVSVLIIFFLCTSYWLLTSSCFPSSDSSNPEFLCVVRRAGVIC